MELRVFGHGFICGSYAKIRLANVEDEDLQELLELFTTLLPTHSDENNLELYLLEGPAAGRTDSSLLLTCSHFEDSSIQEIASISVIMHKLAELTTDGQVYLNYLSTHAEKIIFEIPNPTSEIIDKVKSAIGAQ